MEKNTFDPFHEARLTMRQMDEVVRECERLREKGNLDDAGRARLGELTQFYHTLNHRFDSLTREPTFLVAVAAILQDGTGITAYERSALANGHFRVYLRESG